jgi:hypothetical protein
MDHGEVAGGPPTPRPLDPRAPTGAGGAAVPEHRVLRHHCRRRSRGPRHQRRHRWRRRAAGTLGSPGSDTSPVPGASSAASSVSPEPWEESPVPASLVSPKPRAASPVPGAAERELLRRVAHVTTARGARGGGALIGSERNGVGHGASAPARGRRSPRRACPGTPPPRAEHAGALQPNTTGKVKRPGCAPTHHHHTREGRT